MLDDERKPHPLRPPRLHRFWTAPVLALIAALVTRGPLLAQVAPIPSGEQLSMMLARNAKQLCSVVFVVGRSPEEAMAIGDVIRFDLLRDDWDWSRVDVQVDLARKAVTLAQDPAPPRTAVYHPGQGCTMLPTASNVVRFEPVDVTPDLPPAAQTPWPMGDRTDGQNPRGIDVAVVRAVLDEVFSENDPEEGERGWVVLHDGAVAGEGYGRGYDMHTRNLSFSAGKSVLSTLIGIVVGDGHLDPDAPAPIPEWAAPDARSLITLRNLMQMSSGLDCNNFNLTDPRHFTPENHHSIGYNDGVDAVAASVAPLLRYVPGRVNRYRNCDLLAAGQVLRSTVEREYPVPYLAFPQRYLFDRIGIRTAVIEPDPYGNLLLNGHNYMTTRDWARWGLLYLQDGVFNGARILPRGWAEFVSTPASSNPEYGAFFWLPGTESPLPRDSYWASGAEGNQTVIIPSYGLVIARNAWSPSRDFETVVSEIAAAVIRSRSDCDGRGWRAYGFDEEAECQAYVARRGEIR